MNLGLAARDVNARENERDSSDTENKSLSHAAWTCHERLLLHDRNRGRLWALHRGMLASCQRRSKRSALGPITAGWRHGR